jgi:hypothetical protein
MPRRGFQDFTRAINYLDRLSSRVEVPQNDYHGREVARLLDCNQRTVTNIITAQYLDYAITREETGLTYHIFHPGLVCFLRARSRGIVRDMEEILQEGMVDPKKIVRKLGWNQSGFNYWIRSGKVPSINISASSDPIKKPYYTLPIRDTSKALKMIKSERLGLPTSEELESMAQKFAESDFSRPR